MNKKLFLSLSLAFLLTGAHVALAGNYIWSEKLGLIDMSNVKINDSGLTGYAITVPQRIEFDQSGYRVKNTSDGNLSGNGYNEDYGEVSFDGIRIQKDGTFTGVGNGNKSFGRLYVDCSNYDCASLSIGRLETAWRPSSILDDNKALIGDTDFSYVTDLFHNVEGVSWEARSFSVEIRAAQDFYIIYKRKPIDSTGDKFALKILAYGFNGAFANTADKQKTAKEFFVKNYGRQPESDIDQRVVSGIVFLMGMPGTNPVPASFTQSNTEPSVASVGNFVPTTISTTSAATVANKPAEVKVFVFNTDLKYKQAHADVIKLKKALKKLGYYKSNNLDNKFDENTKQAVIAFQKKYKLTCSNNQPCGLFGKSTRLKLNSLAVKE